MGRTRAGWAVGVATAALLVSGCGGSDGADPPAEATNDAATGDTSDAADGGGDDTDDTGDDGGDSNFTGDCDDALMAFRELHLNYLGSVRAFTPDEPVDYDALVDEVAAAAADPPAPIRDDVRAYADAVTPFYEGLAESGHDPSTPGENDAEAFSALTEALDTSTIEQAVLDIEAWLTGPCDEG